MTKIPKLLKQIQEDPYNEVSAFELPDGGIAVVFSHRITMDEAAIVRITDEHGVLFLNDPEDEEQSERINQRGPWDKS